MSTPTPRPHGHSAPVPGPHGSRHGVPLPGRHLPGAQSGQEPADPARVRAEIDALLAELEARPRVAADADESGVDITRRARILDQAHEVLVQALATVDKI
ncbi:hypothetical protein [Nocardia bovistercoris]|uniref:Uncharacterized protein n=1 Tax=Nocardia bovistercoris TaxID=2785916 RepID=A0A931IIZ5_9NOCA|nr:hypothetical protein [Nocardia bovistercoris]MBH0781185.1 hypothetical protein [Nocardia bovistercoris]